MVYFIPSQSCIDCVYDTTLAQLLLILCQEPEEELTISSDGGL